ncbi:hypothetical protein NDU88_006440 [Pleurodeles waltl]|uniref:Uncharacterized protein n=1 Tax=Pleurodeles waltl TaxID=8319 RepID=A0AAV7WCJ3_PLEWA|nr:hypothetical protein NDU88_006440 [Pleurodeles waltl]
MCSDFPSQLQHQQMEAGPRSIGCAFCILSRRNRKETIKGPAQRPIGRIEEKRNCNEAKHLSTSPAPKNVPTPKLEEARTTIILRSSTVLVTPVKDRKNK